MIIDSNSDCDLIGSQRNLGLCVLFVNDAEIFSKFFCGSAKSIT